jgi:hypothetical protein
MSYEFHLFAPRPGEDPLVTGQNKSDDLPSATPDPAVEAQKHRLAVALITLNFRLKHAPFDYEEMARFNNISVPEARALYRHIEMTGPADGNGVQILIFDDEVVISVPRWHVGKDAAQVFREVWSYFELLSRESGFVTYDPQFDRIVDLENDFGRVLRHYLMSVALVTTHKQRPPDLDEKELVPLGVGALL